MNGQTQWKVLEISFVRFDDVSLVNRLLSFSQHHHSLSNTHTHRQIWNRLRFYSFFFSRSLLFFHVDFLSYTILLRLLKNHLPIDADGGACSSFCADICVFAGTFVHIVMCILRTLVWHTYTNLPLNVLFRIHFFHVDRSSSQFRISVFTFRFASHSCRAQWVRYRVVWSKMCCAHFIFA